MFFSDILPTTPSSIVLSPPPQQQLVGWPTRERDWMEPRPGKGERHCLCGDCGWAAFIGVSLRWWTLLCLRAVSFFRREKWGGEVSISLVVDASNSLMPNLTTTRCSFFYFYSKRVATRVAQPAGIIHFPRRPRLDERDVGETGWMGRWV